MLWQESSNGLTGCERMNKIKILINGIYTGSNRSRDDGDMHI